MKLKNQLCLTVFCLGFTGFFLELLISRVFVFYIGYFGSFFAVPYSLLGLALGSFYYHFYQSRKAQKESIHADILKLALTTAFVFIIFFVISNTALQITNKVPIILIKIFVFGTLFLGPLFICGMLLSRIYSEYQSEIGNLYFLDLFGGALACLMLPFLFHFFDLPIIITILLLFLLVFYQFSRSRHHLGSIGLMAFILIGCLTGFLFSENPQMGNVIASHRLLQAQGIRVHEIYKKWNEYARVSLLEIDHPKKKSKTYRIVQDDGISNIYHLPYRPNQKIKKAGRMEYVPVILGNQPKDVLVMFAGCGKDMIILDNYFKGKAEITGVEINPLVKEICLKEPALESYAYEAFYALPQINYVTAEGRSYLQQNSEQKYDLIFVGAQGSAATSLKQRSSRKYLNTKEAYQQYFDQLQPNGILMFAHSYESNRIRILKYVHEQNIKTDFSRSIFIGRYDSKQLLIVYKKEGFTAKERANLFKHYRRGNKKKPVFYLDKNSRSNQTYQKLVTAPFKSHEKIMSDDRPYEFPIGWNEIFPKDFSWRNKVQRYNALRLISLAFIGFITLLLFLLNIGLVKREEKVPLFCQTYLFLTGFAYMCVQIGLMGKLDLFLGNPLYSMSLIITIFIVWNGLGSRYVHKTFEKLSIKFLLGLSIIGTFLSYLFAELVIKYLIMLPLIFKVLIVIVALAPISFFLGTFFPYVIMLMKNKAPKASVPAAYSLSVISSIFGATYALLVASNIGYQGIMLYAIACYILTLLLVFISKDRFLS